MMNKFREFQHELNLSLKLDEFIHDKLINACRNVFVCHFTCFMPANNLAGLINNLSSSINTYQSIHFLKTFFTDRRFYKHSNNFKSGGRGHY